MRSCAHFKMEPGIRLRLGHTATHLRTDPLRCLHILYTFLLEKQSLEWCFLLDIVFIQIKVFTFHIIFFHSSKMHELPNCSD
ncbi:hypothetical protein MIDIC_370005 [Alphaproteobacteria bacterium]